MFKYITIAAAFACATPAFSNQYNNEQFCTYASDMANTAYGGKEIGLGKDATITTILVAEKEKLEDYEMPYDAVEFVVNQTYHLAELNAPVFLIKDFVYNFCMYELEK